jgi:hypothetical protein
MIPASWMLLILLAIVALIWLDSLSPRPSPAEVQARQEREAQARQEREARNEATRKQRIERERFLCLEAKACKKYSEARLECATAGNFKTCLRIKMGEDSSYSDRCSGYDIGAPAVSLPPDTPNEIQCFLVLTFGID